MPRGEEGGVSQLGTNHHIGKPTYSRQAPRTGTQTYVEEAEAAEVEAEPETAVLLTPAAVDDRSAMMEAW